MITLRRAEDRGHFDHGWLNTYHTFSFADYRDPKHMGFRGLRVINEDRVQPGQGFGTHPHRDMEIITYVLEGGLEHRDSMGNGSIIRPGEVQRMSAGTGVTHSEFNASKAELVHFLQIWLLPAERGIKPGYEQKVIDGNEQVGRLRLIASPDGRDGSVAIHSDACLYAGRFDAGAAAELAIPNARHAWVHVARGKARISGHDLQAGDGAALSDEPTVRVDGIAASEVLVFDLG
jgi:redox-sensitive bicupin YhaK (pirin superfamily)